MPYRHLAFPVLVGLAMGACSSRESAVVQAASPDARTDTAGTCAGVCDATVPSTPVLDSNGGWGDVTTYGGVGNSTPSTGGACNYGATGITHYAAIQVSRLPGDLQGQWSGGRICGQCALVRARTDSGWKQTYVRIVDKCPDDDCGIDLGGAPATELMGAQAGRYAGQWSFVSCQGLPGVSDGLPSLHVKEGSGPYWSRVQVRNPSAAVSFLRLRRDDDAAAAWDTLTWDASIEDFLIVPVSVLADSTHSYQVEAITRDGRAHALTASARAFARSDTDIVFPQLR
jgi:expansin (peptidoglycan-binding protein)